MIKIEDEREVFSVGVRKPEPSETSGPVDFRTRFPRLVLPSGLRFGPYNPCKERDQSGSGSWEFVSVPYLRSTRKTEVRSDCTDRGWLLGPSRRV